MAALLELPAGFAFYKAGIVEAAQRYGLDPVLVAAVCWQESGFNTDAYRFEAMFWNRYLKANPKYRALNPRRVSASYGLMQTMYCRLLEDKVTDNDAWAPELLFLPENGLDIGCAFLGELVAWAQTVVTPQTTVAFVACAAYNGGKGGNDPSKNWPLRNAGYAQAVQQKRDALTKEFENGISRA